MKSIGRDGSHRFLPLSPLSHLVPYELSKHKELWVHKYSKYRIAQVNQFY